MRWNHGDREAMRCSMPRFVSISGQEMGKLWKVKLWSYEVMKLWGTNGYHVVRQGHMRSKGFSRGWMWFSNRTTVSFLHCQIAETIRNGGHIPRLEHGRAMTDSCFIWLRLVKICPWWLPKGSFLVIGSTPWSLKHLEWSVGPNMAERGDGKLEIDQRMVQVLQVLQVLNILWKRSTPVTKNWNSLNIERYWK